MRGRAVCAREKRCGWWGSGRRIGGYAVNGSWAPGGVDCASAVGAGAQRAAPRRGKMVHYTTRGLCTLRAAECCSRTAHIEIRHVGHGDLETSRMKPGGNSESKFKMELVSVATKNRCACVRSARSVGSRCSRASGEVLFGCRSLSGGLSQFMPALVRRPRCRVFGRVCAPCVQDARFRVAHPFSSSRGCSVVRVWSPRGAGAGVCCGVASSCSIASAPGSGRTR